MTRVRCLKPPLATANHGGWKPDNVRGSRQQRGYGRQWEITRERIRERDLGLCQPCARADRVTAGTECDHIVPKSQGGTDDEANLQWICTECHREKSAREGTGGVVENSSGPGI